MSKGAFAPPSAFRRWSPESFDQGGSGSALGAAAEALVLPTAEQI